jgi:hypothetical protein
VMATDGRGGSQPSEVFRGSCGEERKRSARCRVYTLEGRGLRARRERVVRHVQPRLSRVVEGTNLTGVAHQTVRRRGRAQGRDMRLTRRARLSAPACVRTRECAVGAQRRILTSWAEP